MHTYRAPDGTVFNFNSDFSGDVFIARGDEQVKVPGYDLLALVAYCYVSPKRIAVLEQADVDDLLVGKGG